MTDLPAGNAPDSPAPTPDPATLPSPSVAEQVAHSSILKTIERDLKLDKAARAALALAVRVAKIATHDKVVVMGHLSDLLKLGKEEKDKLLLLASELGVKPSDLTDLAKEVEEKVSEGVNAPDPAPEPASPPTEPAK